MHALTPGCDVLGCRLTAWQMLGWRTATDDAASLSNAPLESAYTSSVSGGFNKRRFGGLLQRRGGGTVQQVSREQWTRRMPSACMRTEAVPLCATESSSSMAAI